MKNCFKDWSQTKCATVMRNNDHSKGKTNLLFDILAVSDVDLGHDIMILIIPVGFILVHHYMNHQYVPIN